ncbi:hypothetical protein [Armatimonas rosea]|uniref:Uncharacterized protein n=1 Tax=Armatimonas rosea TaxID=685828 RepID=A0A7W9SSS2_ARMRO|nr:hypothetical protein [Armatimonas rosea]MBB6051373.1 hypothetical protein [Armatimonas rosea]
MRHLFFVFVATLSLLSLGRPGRAEVTAMTLGIQMNCPYGLAA